MGLIDVDEFMRERENQPSRYDFTLYGKIGDRDVWYRWNNGEVTSNDPESLEYLKWRHEHDPGGSVRYGDREWYHYGDLFTDPLSFRKIVEKKGFTEFQGIRGEAPEGQRIRGMY
jgi:hypothetical protein